MRVLIVGSGGREHALAWKVAQSPLVTKLYCAPGNAGMAMLGECFNIRATDIQGLLGFAKEKKIDLAIIGPESPLIAGIADVFRGEGIPTFGPSKTAATIEGSKVFTKDLLSKYGIPTGEYRTFSSSKEAKAFIDQISKGQEELPIVIKADGEAAGKGVFVCDTKTQAIKAIETIMDEKAFGASGDKIVIEERLEGQEASLMVITNGEDIIALPPAQDYKRINDNDQGPNTGGMGCYSPVPVVTPEIYNEVLETAIRPTIKAMKAEGRLYMGLLYAGIILTKNGPKILEFNARFGDPETQVVLPLLENDLIEVIQASLAGSLDSLELKCYNGCAVCVVIASEGYPGNYETGKPIFGLEAASKMENVIIFHAGTKLQNGKVVTSGGRVLGITALGKTFKDAVERAYSAVEKIYFDGMHYRKDIGARAITNNKI
ncbi:MAG: phosphoribosylamine--glycine ligase [Armatimonadetes bacterium]|nr:phosphoribosylamine--glycine ligase [Armatimonadota bacterium]